MAPGVTKLTRHSHYYFAQCHRESHKQEHTTAKINVSLLPDTYRFYFSVKNLPSQEKPGRASLEIMSPEVMAETPFQNKAVCE